VGGRLMELCSTRRGRVWVNGVMMLFSFFD
jgi:hypothetical protein